MQQVRTCDLVQYYQYQVDRQEADRAIVQQRYDQLAAQYEAKAIPKLLGWKYSDSIAGDRTRLVWAGLRLDSFYSEMLLQCTYSQKIGVELMDIPYRSSVAFYPWAADNNLPY